MPDLIAIELVVGLLVLTFAAGYLVGSWRTASTEDALADRIARQTLAELVADQIADDRQALASLPPGLLAGDVWAHAARRGISIREAAEELFTVQAKARLDANVRRHHGRPRRPA